MFSTVLWYIDSSSDNESSVFGQTTEGVPIEYVKQEGKLFAKRLISSNPMDYLDSRFTPGSCVDIRSE